MRYWTEEEARAELPRVRVLVDAVRRAARQQAVSKGNGHAVGREDEDDGREHEDVGREDEEESPARPREEPGSLPTASEAIDELREKGIVLRDPATGLLDFPAMTPSGRVYLLCWRSDEEDLAWWHFAEEGFAGRKPLPVPDDL